MARTMQTPVGASHAQVAAAKRKATMAAAALAFADDTEAATATASATAAATATVTATATAMTSATASPPTQSEYDSYGSDHSSHASFSVAPSEKGNSGPPTKLGKEARKQELTTAVLGKPPPVSAVNQPRQNLSNPKRGSSKKKAVKPPTLKSPPPNPLFSDHFENLE